MSAGRLCFLTEIILIAMISGSAVKPNIHMTFREGSAGICGKGNNAEAESEIIFTCANKVGFPELKRYVIIYFYVKNRPIL